MPKQFKGIAQEFINAMKTHFIGKGADPKDIIVQDLYSYQPPTTASSTSSMLTKLKNGELDELRGMTAQDRNILSAVLAVYNEHVQTKREILTQARNLFDSDMVQTAIDVMTDDGFNSFQNLKEEFKIEYVLDAEELQILGEEYQQQIQNIIDTFVEKFDIKSKAADIIPELIRDGEYAYGILFDEQNKNGVTEIIDDLDVINLIPFYENNKLAFIINQNLFDSKDELNSPINISVNSNTKPMAYKPDNIVFFRLNSQKKRINMSCFYDSEFKKMFYERTHIKLPKFIRTSLPLYYNAMGTLNRLKIMENVSTVLDMTDVLKPEIVQVTVPTNTSSVDAKRIMRDYERQLNDIGDLSNDANMTDFASMAARANKRKVIPQWMDTKGTLNSAAINQGSKGQNAWDSIDRLRNLAALMMGLPPFYFNISGTPMEKAQTIKLFSRYTRKLTALQTCLGEGVKDFIMAELTHRGIKISRDNLVVKFKALTSGDTLEDTDLLVGLVAGINDLYKSLDEITASDNNDIELDNEQFLQLFNELTSKYLNISNLLKINPNKFDNIEGQDGGFEPIGTHAPREHGSSEVTPVPSMDMSFDTGGQDEYDDFVQNSNDIGLPGTEPAVEEI